MANKTTAPEEARQLLEIEALREKHGISRPVFMGTCTAGGWKPGKAMTEEAFLQAVADFTGAPMGALQGKRG